MINCLMSLVILMTLFENPILVTLLARVVLADIGASRIHIDIELVQLML